VAGPPPAAGEGDDDADDVAGVVGIWLAGVSIVGGSVAIGAVNSGATMVGCGGSGEATSGTPVAEGEDLCRTVVSARAGLVVVLIAEREAVEPAIASDPAGFCPRVGACVR